MPESTMCLRREREMNGGRLVWRSALLAMAGALAMDGSALAQGASAGTDYRGSINSSLGLVGANQDAATVLFPAVAAMEAPPREPDGVRAISLMTSASPEWAQWVSWVEAPPQKAVLEALTKIADPKNKYVMGFKYGREGVDAAWVKAGLYVDLGKPPLLAMGSSECQYLEPMEDVSRLCTVEAARLAAAGKGAEAIGVIVNWFRVSRMVTDRQFALEKAWGLIGMIQACERLCDLAYQHPDAFTEKAITDLQREIDARAITQERIRFPEGEKAALMELVKLTFEDRGAPKANEFPVYLGLVKRGDFALQSFGAADWWSRVAAGHAGYFDTLDQIEKVFGDWQKRWSLTDLFDPLLVEPTDFSKMDRAKFAMVEAFAADMDVLFDLRATLGMQVIGTRAALACIGFRARNKQWPPNLAAVQPVFLSKLDDDPWSFDPKSNTRRTLQYFVPIRDSVVGPRETAKPLSVTVWLSKDADEGPPLVLMPARIDFSSVSMSGVMIQMLRDLLRRGLPAGMFNEESGHVDLGAFKDYLKKAVERVVTGDPLKRATDAIDKIDETTARSIAQAIKRATAYQGERESFTVELTEKTFVLYSVGADGQRDLARDVGAGGKDILLFPPLLSLERQRGPASASAAEGGDAK